MQVELTLSNERGETRASLASVLAAQSRDLAWLVDASLEPGAFTSDVQLELASGDGIGLMLVSYVSESRISGRLWGSALHREPTPDDANPFDVERLTGAVWPAGNECGLFGHPVAPDETIFDVRPREVALGLPETLDLTWLDGSTTEVTFTLLVSEMACLAMGCEKWCPELQGFELRSEEPVSPVLLELPVTIAVATRDGRWRGNLDAQLWIEARRSGGLTRAFLRHQSEHASAAALAAATGLEVESGDAMISVGMLVTYTLEASGLTARGGIGVHGPARAERECDEDEMCSGAAVSDVLLGATISLEP